MFASIYIAFRIEGMNVGLVRDQDRDGDYDGYLPIRYGPTKPDDQPISLQHKDRNSSIRQQ